MRARYRKFAPILHLGRRWRNPRILPPSISNSPIEVIRVTPSGGRYGNPPLVDSGFEDELHSSQGRRKSSPVDTPSAMNALHIHRLFYLTALGSSRKQDGGQGSFLFSEVPTPRRPPSIVPLYCRLPLIREPCAQRREDDPRLLPLPITRLSSRVRHPCSRAYSYKVSLIPARLAVDSLCSPCSHLTTPPVDSCGRRFSGCNLDRIG